MRRHASQRLILMVLSILVLAGYPASGLAHEPTKPYAPQKGVTIGLRFSGTGLETGELADEAALGRIALDRAGGGLSLSVGYTFNENVSLVFDLAGSGHDTNVPGVKSGYGTGVLELRYQFVAQSKFQPFFLGGLGGATISVPEAAVESRVNGGVAVLGAGVQMWLARHWRLELKGRADFINWDRREVRVEVGPTTTFEDPLDASGQATRLEFGAIWAF